MPATYILPAIGIFFLLLAGFDYLRRGHFTLQQRIWLLVGVIFLAVSLYLRWMV